MTGKRLPALAALLVLGIAIYLAAPSRDVARARTTREAKAPEPRLIDLPIGTGCRFQPTERQAPEPGGQLVQFEEFDGGRVAGLPGRFRTGDETIESETDDSGAVEIERKDADEVHVEVPDPAWKVTKGAVVKPGEPATVVVHRELRVHGRIRVMDEPAPDLTTVRVGYSIGSSKTPNEDGVPRIHRMARSGIRPDGQFANADGKGEFTGTIPRVAGWVVHASAPGWFSESVPIPTDHDGDSVEIVLELRKGVRLHGRLVDDAGDPVPKGTVVHAYITIRGAPETLTVEEAYRLRGSARCGMTGAISEVHGESIFHYHYVARTNEAGEYAMIVQHEGEVIARAYVDGHAPATGESAWLPTQGQRLDLTAKRDIAPATVEVRIDGILQRNEPVRIIDLIPRGPHMGAGARTDGEGRLPTSWLQPGHHYTIMVGEPPNGVRNSMYFQWKGQRSLDVIPWGKKGHKKLPKDWW